MSNKPTQEEINELDRRLRDKQKTEDKPLRR